MPLLKKRKTKNDDRPQGRHRRASSASYNKKSASFSYGTTRQDAKTLAEREEKRAQSQIVETSPWKFWVSRIGLLVLILAITASITSSLTLSTDVKIYPVEDNESSGLFLAEEHSYKAAVQKQLASSILNQNKVTINTNKISQELLKQFPELSSVEVSLPLLAHQPVIKLKAAEPSMILNSRSGSFVLDVNGRALIPSGKMPSSVKDKLPQVNDQSNLDFKVGDQIITRNNVKFIEEVVAQLSSKQIQVESFTLPAESSQLEAKIAGVPYFVKFNLQTPPEARQQAGTYLATRAMLERNHTSPSKYIDVRVEGRAYYQ